MVFVIGSVYVMDVYGSAYVEPALHPRDEGDLIMMDRLFDVLLDSFASILLTIFASTFITDIGLKFSSNINFLHGLWKSGGIQGKIKMKG